MPTLRSAIASDADKMKYVNTIFMGQDEATYDTSDLYNVFQAEGIVGFHSDFLCLSRDDLMELPTLKSAIKRKLICVIACFLSLRIS